VNGESSVMSVFNEAAEFFDKYLYDYRPWSKNLTITYEKGSWERCHDISIHTWNNVFYVELASLRGRLLNTDEVLTLNKDRMDYAHLLVSTTILKE
jgi:hypothetical protein